MFSTVFDEENIQRVLYCGLPILVPIRQMPRLGHELDEFIGSLEFAGDVKLTAFEERSIRGSVYTFWECVQEGFEDPDSEAWWAVTVSPTAFADRGRRRNLRFDANVAPVLAGYKMMYWDKGEKKTWCAQPLWPFHRQS